MVPAGTAESRRGNLVRRRRLRRVRAGQPRRGAVVATPYGRGVVLAKTVIDATGNSDVAAAAGAGTIYTDASEFGMQGTGLPGRRLGGSYNNTDFTIVDETDMVDIWHVLVYAKDKYPNAFDHGRLIDTRERRRIVGDSTITLPDQINERTYPDTVCRCLEQLRHARLHGRSVPAAGASREERHLRRRAPAGHVAQGPGRDPRHGAGHQRPSRRRAADPHAARHPERRLRRRRCRGHGRPSERAIRQIDVKALQQHLVEIGNLPESVLTDQDSYPLPDERIAQAVADLKQGRGAAVIMTAPERALPLVREAYRTAAGDEDKLTYARTLAVLGDDTGLETLLAKVRSYEQWDEGWNYRGMGQFGAALSELDNLLVALGRAGNAKAVPAILDKMRQLDAQIAFSHHRAVGLALELIGDRSAAEPLAELLAKPGMTGYVHQDVQTAIEKGVPGGTNAEQTRRESLRELMLARALYRCGDCEGLGEKILRDYTQDLRGHLARHAAAVLAEGKAGAAKK